MELTAGSVMRQLGISKKQIVEMACNTLIGEGYKLYCVRVPDEEEFTRAFRHFDHTGLSFLTPEIKFVPMQLSDDVRAEVEFTFANCEKCNKSFYRVENVLLGVSGGAVWEI